MKNCLVFFFAIMLTLTPVLGQQSFQFPSTNKKLPITYLENLDVGNTARRLNFSERQNLCRLLVRSYVVSVRQYKQDYPLSIKSPVFKLVESNFPEISKRVHSSEGFILLEEVTKFFNRMPDYKPTVDETLKIDVGGKHCQ